MPFISITAWNITKDQPIPYATATFAGREQVTDSFGIADMGQFGVGDYPITVTPPEGYEPPFETYLFHVVETNATHRFDFYEAEALPPAPPTEFGEPVESYKGVDIFQNASNLKYYYFTAGIRSSYFDSLAQAHASIDSITAPVTPTPPPAKIPDTTVKAPSNLGPFQGVAEWFGNVIQWLVTQITTPLSGIGSAIGLLYQGLGGKLDDQAVATNAINSSLGGIGGAIAEGISAKTNEIVQRSIAEALANVQVVLPGAVGNSPEWKTNIDATLNPYANQIVAALMAEVSPAKFAHSQISPEEAKDALNTMAGGILAVEIGLFLANAALEGATLGQVEAISQLENMVVSKLGLNQIASAAVTIPLEALVMKKARQYYAALYPSELPGIGELTNMRMKEVIGQPAFRQWIKLQGFEEAWADKFWDAHYTPPSLSDILTAWRRKIPVNIPFEDPATGEYMMRQVDQLSDDDVKSLMERVDLDPRYFDIFATRKYITPGISMTRFLFETGAIKTRQEVVDLVSLEGYEPKYVESITDFIVNFQARRWRVRYLQALSTGYVRGVRTAAQVHAAVLDAGYTEDVSKWLIDSANVRLDIEKAKGTAAGGKLLSEGELKKLYLKSHLSADQLRTELALRGYGEVDIALLIVMLDEEKVVVSAGGSKVALSVPELLSAMRYEKMTEDQVSIELQLRGLSLQEVEILIATKKAQWGMGQP